MISFFHGGSFESISNVSILARTDIRVIARLVNANIVTLCRRGFERAVSVARRCLLLSRNFSRGKVSTVLNRARSSNTTPADYFPFPRFEIPLEVAPRRFEVAHGSMRPRELNAPVSRYPIPLKEISRAYDVKKVR